MSDSIYTSEYRQFARGAGRTAPDWLAHIRRCSLERFEALGFPTRKNEDWHFTSVAPIIEAAYPPRSAPGGDVAPGDLAPFTFGASDWPTIVFVNGVFAPALSSLDALPEGVRVYDLASAVRDNDPLVERHLSKIAPYELHAFTGAQQHVRERWGRSAHREGVRRRAADSRHVRVRREAAKTQSNRARSSWPSGTRRRR
jgi:hypothetical protein